MVTYTKISSKMVNPSGVAGTLKKKTNLAPCFPGAPIMIS